MKPNSAGPPPHKTPTGQGSASCARKLPRTMQNVPSPTYSRLDAASHSRVLIPRLERREVAARPQRSRVSRACNNCRTRRTKCSGEQPRCKECQANSLPCVYEQSRKDRLQEATDQRELLVLVLQDVSHRVNEQDRDKIHDALERVGASAPSPIPSAATVQMREDPEDDLQIATGGNDHMDDAPASQGQNSPNPDEVAGNQWLLNLQQEFLPLHGPALEPSGDLYAECEKMQDLEECEPSTQRESHLKNTYFYLDGDPVEIDMSVNPYEVPDLDTADRLFQCYLEAVMGWLPIIPLELMNQMQNWYETPYQTPKQWKAIMNLIFSIGSRYSDLLKNDDELPSDDHALYMSKAVRLLELNDTLMTLSAPDLPMVQFFAILSFYYLITGHANRAWITIGISVRYAISCDLHLRNSGSPPPNDNEEDLSRTWWSLQHLECLLSTITGRPCGIYNIDFNISLPKGLLKSPGRYSPGFLTAQIKLGLITRRALVSLYSVRAAVTPWQDIQKSISTLSFEMDEWSRMTFSDENCSILSLLSEREKKILDFGYLSTKMLLTRPCLSPPKQQSEDNNDSVSFDQRMACVCVQTAQDLSRLLPEISDTRIIGEGPWWCIVHYIMQALAVLFLEISSGSAHVSNTKINITSPMKKLFDWLKFLRKRDGTAERALKVVGALLKRAHHLDDISVMLWNDQADTYGGHLVQSHMWQDNYLDNLSSYPQFPASFNQLPGNSVSDMSADFDFFMDPMPFPPVYGNAFADDILANSN